MGSTHGRRPGWSKVKDGRHFWLVHIRFVVPLWKSDSQGSKVLVCPPRIPLCVSARSWDYSSTAEVRQVTYNEIQAEVPEDSDLLIGTAWYFRHCDALQVNS